MSEELWLFFIHIVVVSAFERAAVLRFL